MSEQVTTFNPATLQATSFTTPFSAGDGTLVFWNESNISLNLVFQNGDTMYLPAWYNRHKTGASGSVYIQWAVHTVLNSGLAPTSEVIVEAFNSYEDFPGDGPLVRQANGDTNTTNVGDTLVNTGNTPGTQIINIQPSDVTGVNPTISADNSGNVTISGDNAGVLTQLFKLVAGASPEVILAATNILTLIQGNLKYIGTLNGDNGKITSDGAGNVNLQTLQLNSQAYLDSITAGSLFQIGDSVANAGNILDIISTGSWFAKSGVNSGASFNWQSPNGTTKWQRSAEATITGTGNGTHGVGFSPHGIAFDPCTVSGSTQTIGSTVAGTLTVTTGAGLAWLVYCYNV